MTAIGIQGTVITCSTITVAVSTCVTTIADTGAIAVIVGIAIIAGTTVGTAMAADAIMTIIAGMGVDTTAAMIADTVVVIAVRAQSGMAAGMAATTTGTTAGAAAAMAVAGVTTARIMVKAMVLLGNQILSRWHVPVPTGAANGAAAVMAKDVAAISNRPLPHRKTLRHSHSSPKCVKSGLPVSAMCNKPLARAQTRHRGKTHQIVFQTRLGPRTISSGQS